MDGILTCEFKKLEKPSTAILFAWKSLMEERILGTLLGPEGTKVRFGPTFQIIKVKDPLV